jgi:hypothetical protein
MPFAPQIEERLRALFRAIKILSPAEFSLAGRRFPAGQAAPPPGQAAPLPGAGLITAMQSQIYAHAYCRRFTGALDAEPTAQPPADEFLEELMRANQGRERWEDGWQVYQADPSGAIFAHKNGLTQMFFPGQFVPPAGGGSAVQQGAVIRVLMAKESTTMQPGFYIVLSERSVEQLDQVSFVRFYWNIAAEGAATLTSAVTGRFNRFQVPFRFKCLSIRQLYGRADAAVLFVPRRFYQFAAQLVEEIYPMIGENLRPDTPLFSKTLAPGLGLAEDMGNGQSFGLTRCALLAEAIWSAYVKGVNTEEARLEETVERFRQNHLDIRQPHLLAGSADIYELPALLGRAA